MRDGMALRGYTIVINYYNYCYCVVVKCSFFCSCLFNKTKNHIFLNTKPIIIKLLLEVRNGSEVSVS